jgi:hypothetical protein
MHPAQRSWKNRMTMWKTMLDAYFVMECVQRKQKVKVSETQRISITFPSLTTELMVH